MQVSVKKAIYIDLLKKTKNLRNIQLDKIKFL